MVRHQFASVIACALSLTIAGCGVIETKKIDYKSAGSAPTLEVPPDLTAPSASDRYALPDTGSRGSATLSTYNAERQAKPGATESREVIPKSDTIRVERAWSAASMLTNCGRACAISGSRWASCSTWTRQTLA